MEGTGRRLVLPPSVGCDGGGGVLEVGDLFLLPPEHSGAIYCDSARYGPVYGVEAESRANSGNAVVGTGRSRFGGDADGGP